MSTTHETTNDRKCATQEPGPEIDPLIIIIQSPGEEGIVNASNQLATANGTASRNADFPSTISVLSMVGVYNPLVTADYVIENGQQVMFTARFGTNDYDWSGSLIAYAEQDLTNTVYVAVQWHSGLKELNHQQFLGIEPTIIGARNTDSETAPSRPTRNQRSPMTNVYCDDLPDPCNTATESHEIIFLPEARIQQFVSCAWADTYRVRVQACIEGGDFDEWISVDQGNIDDLKSLLHLAFTLDSPVDLHVSRRGDENCGYFALWRIGIPGTHTHSGS